jgi:hypothetical protein
MILRAAGIRAHTIHPTSGINWKPQQGTNVTNSIANTTFIAAAGEAEEACNEENGNLPSSPQQQMA